MNRISLVKLAAAVFLVRTCFNLYGKSKRNSPGKYLEMTFDSITQSQKHEIDLWIYVFNGNSRFVGYKDIELI